MKLRGQKGFTLIEVIVVAGIIAILAGILVPLIFKEIDESKISRASADIRSISTALIVLRKDTGQWPVSTTCTPTVTLIAGAGTLPTLGSNWSSATSEQFDNYLNKDNNNCWSDTFKGPYMATVNADPWGKQYVMNGEAFLFPSMPVWIISAGPNGVIDTDAQSQSIAIGVDDIGMRLR
jgi:general secretion pathway protein G